MNGRSFGGLLVLVAMAACAGQPRGSAATMEQRFKALSAVEDATGHISVDRAKGAIIGAAYVVLFGVRGEARAMEGMEAGELEFVYRGAELAAFYAIEDAYVRDMALAVGALEARGAASKAHHKHLYEMYVRARMLDEARALARRHAEAGRAGLPEVRDASDLVAGRATAWIVEQERAGLVRQNIDLPQRGIVIVSHPQCHFSQNAAEAIAADPTLAGIFAGHARWLAPQDGHLDVEMFQAWNREHPAQQMALAFKRDEWPMIDRWGTPTFYFFDGGAVRTVVTGWPKEGRRDELIAAARQIGL